MLFAHRQAIVDHRFGRHLATLAEAEIFGEGDRVARLAAEERRQRLPPGFPAQVPKRNLDRAEGFDDARVVGVLDDLPGRHANAFARRDVERVLSREGLAHRDDHRANIGRGRFAEADEAFVGLHFDNRLGRAGIKPASPPERRFERDVDRGHPDVRDFHGPPLAALAILVFWRQDRVALGAQ